MKTLVIWFNTEKKSYYYRLVKNTYKKYFVGYRNQYNHEVVLIIPLSVFYSHCKKITYPHKALKRFISFLQNIEKKL